MTHRSISRIFATLAALSAANPARAMPPWAKSEGFAVQGNIVKAPCDGHGPSAAQARQDAINGCKASATQFLQKHTKVRSMSIETERDVAFHQEVSEESTYTNLVCIPEKESVEEPKDGLWTVWILCRIDLSKADIAVNSAVATDSRVKIQSHALTSVDSANIKSASQPASSVSDENRIINLVSVPPCSEVLIKGARARIHRCTPGANEVMTFKGDESLVIRARGFVPKTIELSGKAWVNHEMVQVILQSE